MKKKTFIILTALLILCCAFLIACEATTSTADTTGTDADTTGTDAEQSQETEKNETFINPGDNLGGGKEGTIPTEAVTLSAEDADFSVDLSEEKEDTDASTATALTESSETVTITTAGSYLLTGTYGAGIEIAVGNGETTHLFLSNATISNSDGIAVSNTNKKSDLIITLVADTENTVSNQGTDVNAIHVKGTLTINGTGKLTVTSTCKSGIKVSKALKIVDAQIEIDCQNHAVSARSITAEDAKITVTNAAKDGLNAECDDETQTFPEDYSEGFIMLKNVEFTCSVDGDGLQADTLVFVDGGTLDITTNGSFVSYSATNIATYELTDDDYRYIKSGTTYQKVASDYNGQISKMYALKQSCKGIKVGEIKYEDESGAEITVTEGKYLIALTGDNKITVDSTDDAIHTNSGDLLVLNGNITVSTYDDGLTCDGLTQIDGGTINIKTSYEGIEGSYVKITGGTIALTSSDDGINAASDDTSIKEYIIITGGTITVNATGDGLDSNGSILMTGGSLTVHGPTSSMDAGLDAETGIIVQGGTLFVTSSLGMTETPSTNSTQYVVSYAQSTSIASGTVIAVKNSAGEELLTVTVQKTCQTVIFSLPALQQGESYTVYGNDSELATFTVSSVITSVGSAKSAGQGGGQGGQGGGLTPPGGDFNPNQGGGNGQPTLPSGDFDPNQGGGNRPALPSGDNGQPTPPSGDFDPNQAGGNGNSASADSTDA